MKKYIILHIFALLLCIAAAEGSTNVGKSIIKRSVFEQIGLTISCSVCEMLVSIFHTAAQSNVPLFLVELQFIPLCKFVQNSVVCNGIFETFAPDVIAAFKHVKIGPKEICSMLHEDCPQIDIPSHEWTVTLPRKSKPPLQVNRILKTNKAIKVLQLNDIHLDLYYTVGSNSNCDQPNCCRNEYVDNISTEKIPAEKWGNFRCDTPLETLEYILKSIKKQHPDIAYIMWLGDTVPRHIWRETKLDQLIPNRKVTSILKRIFPNTLVLPNIGNHDISPDGCYPPPWVTDPKFSISWFSKEMAKLWRDWIPQSQKRNILYGGYYSIQPRPGLRILSLNTLYCHCRNWWLYVNSADPAEQLQWLVNQLQQAEDNGEKVHITGHIPPGDKDCLRVWSRNYYDIVNRYESTIAAQFFGHTHYDEFEVFYDTKNLSRPVNVAYIGASVTPSEGGNPSYRIYHIDGASSRSTWKVIDYETWILDLNKANKNLDRAPELVKLYSAKESYSLENLEPTEWNKLIYRMREDSQLFDKFYRHYYTNSSLDGSYHAEEKLRILCCLKSAKARSSDELCNDLEV